MSFSSGPSEVSLNPAILPGWAGPTLASQTKTRELIKHNHDNHHIFQENNIVSTRHLMGAEL